MQHRSLASLFALSILSTTVLIGCSQGEQQQQQQQAPEVGVITLEAQAVPRSTELPGRTEAYKIAEVRPQVGGILLERLFTEGTDVDAGEQLYQIDPALFEAQFNSAEASVKRARAVQKTTKARFDRSEELLSEEALSQQDFDDIESEYLSSEAELLVAEAEYQQAKLDLEYTKVNAPISGRIGRSNYTAGALLSASQAEPLAVIQQLDPIYVNISQSADEYFALKRDIESGRIEANSEGNPPVELRISGSDKAVTGELLFSEVSVEQSTGSIALRALVDNPDNTLLPGMFVRTQITNGVMRNAILAPQQAVTRDPRGRAIAMVVNDDSKVEARIVETEQTIGSDWLIRSGLEAGDVVVVDGLQRIQPGAEVTTVEVDLSTEVPEGSQG